MGRGGSWRRGEERREVETDRETETDRQTDRDRGEIKVQMMQLKLFLLERERENHICSKSACF